ncbi:M20 family metallopeptidase [Curvibacter sp. RS43]|uniref:M20 family metallopeptidase n=1 Tax=Curvibacter microcysteis TaxID=3026419 RepID=UPI002362A81C|nr:M20 family metallopeptidase [Curvibacter sp. RS43]MDD0811977.1 M20 family metallopeptidase [Curvibacter sp. RS43]
MTRTQLLAQVHQYFDTGGLATDLNRRLGWRTESDLGPDAPAATQTALRGYLSEEILPWLSRLGFEVQIHDNPVAGAGPLLLAHRVEDPALPTVLSYGHGDVVNGQDARWREGLSPWTLTIEGDRWYGRGSADNKGQHSIVLAALEHTLQARQQRLGYNVTVLLEMGEEAGSPGLAAFCEQQRRALSADLFLASDGPRAQASRPTLFLGSRGAVNFSLRVNSRERAYHSGNWGGVLSNPAIRLSHALASLVGPQGRVLVPGLLPPPPPERLRQALREVPVGGGIDDPELSPGWGEPGLSPAEQLVGWNTLEVLALGAGSATRPVNAIPPNAVAHCQLRFVVGTDWTQLQDHVRAHLDAQGFEEVQVEVSMACGATRLDLDNPWVDWALNSMQASAGHPAVLMPNLAGSLPNDLFADGLGLPTLWVPHSYPACAQHAPNEHLLGSVAREGLAVMAGLFWDLGEPGSAPWVSGRVHPSTTAA